MHPLEHSEVADRPRPTPHLPNPGRLEGEEPPRWLLPLMIAISVLFIVALALMGHVRSEPAVDPAPTPSPSPSSTWSPECTPEDLDDGACYTWDDIRDLEWHTISPAPAVTP